ncbi:Mov34/MPN/PAD-1 family protein [Vibrio fluvialis]|uniref:CBASS system CD-NTase/cGAS isopeptidase Cap3 n=1 Tax=Vibrio fluvialis TaxID=676 RepID=UPI00301DE1ED
MVDNELIFEDSNGNLVVVMNNVVKSLFSHRQLHRFSKESAGVLIGERRGSHIVICDLSEPGPGDVRSRFRVNRKGPHHQDKVDAEFVQSGGTRQYIGEWHSHPEDSPSPSSIDKYSWKRSIDSSSPMLVLIVGRKTIWMGKKIGSSIIQLKQTINSTP